MAILSFMSLDASTAIDPSCSFSQKSGQQLSQRQHKAETVPLLFLCYHYIRVTTVTQKLQEFANADLRTLP